MSSNFEQSKNREQPLFAIGTRLHHQLMIDIPQILGIKSVNHSLENNDSRTTIHLKYKIGTDELYDAIWEQTKCVIKERFNKIKEDLIKTQPEVIDVNLSFSDETGAIDDNRTIVITSAPPTDSD